MGQRRVPNNDPESPCKSELEPSFSLAFLSGELCAVFYIRVKVVPVHFLNLCMYFLCWFGGERGYRFPKKKDKLLQPRMKCVFH